MRDTWKERELVLNASKMASNTELTDQGWERSDFPIACETCLGDNPYVRMQKTSYGQACHVCARPFTVFRWKAGTDGRYKKTVVCQTCAKMKNVCQVCLLDLQYGIPAHVRDRVVKEVEGEAGQEEEEGINATSLVHRQFVVANAEEKFQNEGLEAMGKHKMRVAEALQKVARTEPYYKRNRARPCMYWLRGECNRGEQCPYLHEVPEHDIRLGGQNIRDRYYGENDPVARKMLGRLNSNRDEVLVHPTDLTISTLYVGGVDSEVTEEDLQSALFVYGEIEEIHKKQEKFCAFVRFARREDAERAIEDQWQKFAIRGKPLRICWARPRGGQSQPAQSTSASVPERSGPLPPMPPTFEEKFAKQTTHQGMEGMPAPEAVSLPANFSQFPPPPNPQTSKHTQQPTYPSMDPNRLGTRYRR